MATPTPPTPRFGIFEANLEAGELRKAGRRIALQEQPFRILVHLLHRGGQVVTRRRSLGGRWMAAAGIGMIALASAAPVWWMSSARSGEDVRAMTPPPRVDGTIDLPPDAPLIGGVLQNMAMPSMAHTYA